MIRITRAGPGITLQDQGRQGYLAQGLSRGGAADPLALLEGAALLDQPPALGAIEIAGSYLSVAIAAPVRIALTGAVMRATCDGVPLVWHASHALPAGAQLDLSGATGGYSYLHFGGGIAATRQLGAISAHLAAGLGQMLQPETDLPLGTDRGGPVGLGLAPQDRFAGGLLRIVTTPQTALFDSAEIARFCQTRFAKDAHGNRMGQRLVCEGAGFALRQGLSILSETIVPGDIQITGAGAPFVLLAECQTTGGYPRIGTVLPCDLPRLVQAPAKAAVWFDIVPLAEAARIERAEHQRRATLGRGLRPLVRDPHQIADLLAYQLISGATRGDDLDQTGTALSRDVK